MDEWMTYERGATRSGKKEDAFRKSATRKGWEKKEDGGKVLVLVPASEIASWKLSTPVSEAYPTQVVDSTSMLREHDLEIRLAAALKQLADMGEMYEQNLQHIKIVEKNRCDAEAARSGLESAITALRQERDAENLSRDKIIKEISTRIDEVEKERDVFHDIYMDEVMSARLQEEDLQGKINVLSLELNKKDNIIKSLKSRIDRIDKRDTSFRSLPIWKRPFGRLPDLDFQIVTPSGRT